jgi:hypothetical protein
MFLVSIDVDLIVHSRKIPDDPFSSTPHYKMCQWKNVKIAESANIACT